jgi:hypothetical protein
MSSSLLDISLGGTSDDLVRLVPERNLTADDADQKMSELGISLYLFLS